MKYDENKIVIFDWGGIVESHREGEYSLFKVLTNILQTFNPKVKENEVIQGWKECSKDKNGIEIGATNDIKQIKGWYERVQEKFSFKSDFTTFQKIYHKDSLLSRCSGIRA